MRNFKLFIEQWGRDVDESHEKEMFGLFKGLEKPIQQLLLETLFLGGVEDAIFIFPEEGNESYKLTKCDTVGISTSTIPGFVDVELICKLVKL